MPDQFDHAPITAAGTDNLDETIAAYPKLEGADLRFLPARLGGTAPTYEEAYEKDHKDMTRKRDEFTG